MSIYDNETKICPDLNPTAPQEPQTYRLKKLTEIEAFFLDEIEERRREAKKTQKKPPIKYNHRYRRNRLNYLINDRSRSLYPTICQRCRPACWRCLGRAWGSSFPFNGRYTKISRSQTAEQGKYDAIMVLAQGKLDSIADIISQAMQDGDISPAEFHKVFQAREKYRKLKADIRNRTKAKVRQMEKEQREEILEQGKKEGKEVFLRQIANSSSTQGVNAI